MPTLKYTLSSRVYQGKAEVLARFYSGKSFSQRAKTHIMVPADAWDEQNGTIIIPRKIALRTQELFVLQKKLNDLRDSIFNAWWKDQYEAKSGWLQGIVDMRTVGRNLKDRKLVSDVVRECYASKKIHPHTAQQYEVLARALDRYSESLGPLYCDDFTPERVEDFVQFFRQEERPTKKGGTRTVRRGNNTVVTKLKRLASACAYAVRKKYMVESPFGLEEDGKYQIPSEVYGKPISLRISERDMLQHFDFGDPYLNLCRDIFIFQCHVGCRVSDLFELTKDNLTEDGFLEYIQTKKINVDPTPVRVPVDDVAKELLSRYDCPDGRLFPFPQPNEFNKIIHVLGKTAGLTRKVWVVNPITEEKEVKELWEVMTSHKARKTFMQHIFKKTKDSLVTSSFTGHSPNTKAFVVYAEVDDEMKLDIMSQSEK